MKPVGGLPQAGGAAFKSVFAASGRRFLPSFYTESSPDNSLLRTDPGDLKLPVLESGPEPMVPGGRHSMVWRTK
jgi:hypothetical protein